MDARPTTTPDEAFSTDPLMIEARRVLSLCNICGYCTGYCEAFRSARRCKHLTDEDLYYLAVLCHNCRDCYYSCQYAPPHAFDINVPALLARVRGRAYRRYMFPAWFRGRDDRAVPAVGTLLAVFLAIAVPLIVLLRVPSEVLFAGHTGAGSFYKIIPWEDMIIAGAVTFGLGLLSLSISAVRFWWAISKKASIFDGLVVFPKVLREALSLRQMTGGGIGCADRDDVPSDIKRRLHQVLVTGVALCFLATVTASFYHHVYAIEAPYSFASLPVLSGTIGGLMILAASAGLVWRKFGIDPAPTASETLSEDNTFLGLLSGVALSGLALLAFRETGLMGLLLAIHIGAVMGLFLTLSMSKFRHVPFRLVALTRAALERKNDRK